MQIMLECRTELDADAQLGIFLLFENWNFFFFCYLSAVCGDNDALLPNAVTNYFSPTKLSVYPDEF